MPPTITQTLETATKQLKESSDSPRLDAEVLLAHAIGKDRTYLYTWPEKELSPDNETVFLDLIEKRHRGDPIAYLTGYQEFWSLNLKVTPDTLIPRPETEIVVEQALAVIPKDRPCKVADLGVGSGAIALAIASERPRCQVIGVDQSTAAIRIAETNARQLGIENARFQEGNWLAGFEPNSFDVIVANPPYVAISDPHLAEGDVRFEPQSALVSGVDGLDDIKIIIRQAQTCLKKKGWLIMEHGYDQQARILSLLKAAGYRETRGMADYAGQPRIVLGRVE